MHPGRGYPAGPVARFQLPEDIVRTKSQVRGRSPTPEVPRIVSTARLCSPEWLSTINAPQVLIPGADVGIAGGLRFLDPLRDGFDGLFSLQRQGPRFRLFGLLGHYPSADGAKRAATCL